MVYPFAPFVAQVLALVLSGPALKPECELPPPDPKVNSFSLTIPLDVGHAFTQAVRAFVASGHPPTNTTQSTVEWAMAPTNDGITSYRRMIRAAVYATGDSVSMVTLTAIEDRDMGAKYGTRQVALDQGNGGNGRKVWCAMKAIADSLKGWYPQKG